MNLGPLLTILAITGGVLVLAVIVVLIIVLRKNAKKKAIAQASQWPGAGNHQQMPPQRSQGGAVDVVVPQHQPQHQPQYQTQHQQPPAFQQPPLPGGYQNHIPPAPQHFTQQPPQQPQQYQAAAPALNTPPMQQPPQNSVHSPHWNGIQPNPGWPQAQQASPPQQSPQPFQPPQATQNDHTPQPPVTGIAPTPSSNMLQESGASGRVNPAEEIPDSRQPGSEQHDFWAPPGFTGPAAEKPSVQPELVTEVSSPPKPLSPEPAEPVEVQSDLEVDSERTVLSSHRRAQEPAAARWQLLLPNGEQQALTQDRVLLGRKPDADPAYPETQLIAVNDEGRTVSKNHALMIRTEQGWQITDLQSTNGVVLLDQSVQNNGVPNNSDLNYNALQNRSEELLPLGGSGIIGEEFLLGEAKLQLQKII